MATIPSVFGADPRDYAVEISVNVLASPLALQLTWPGTDIARQYYVRKRTWGATSWGSPIATLPADAMGYTDPAVNDGTAYEYEVQMETIMPATGGGWASGYGYVCAGANVPAVDYKGKVLLLVDSSVSAAIANELNTFQSDLLGAGWSVVRRDVSRTASPATIRDQVKAEYNADPANLRSVVLIGHVPVPYSGNIAPDLHEAHRGAWPADVFYGELDGNWTDNTVNVTSFDSGDNDNRPGDGKYDQSEIPSAVELEVGRIDFWNLPAFAPRTETDLLRNYLRKDHEFRHRGFTAARRGLIRDNFGDLDGDAPAVDAWRHYPQFFGAGNIQEVGAGQFFPTLSSESFLWAYGCGGGGYTKADGVGSTFDFAASDPKAVFLVLHGSYFGDWNNNDNFLRAAIATPNYSLESIWSGLPHWFMHPMGLGATVGLCTRLTQNNLNDYKSYQNFSPRQVHIALMGDPTLEMFPVVPPSNLTASPGASVTLNWSGAPETGLVGYHVYSSSSASGPFQRVTGSPVTGTSFSHSVGPGTYYYMVRALKLEQTGSGTYYNLSQGITTSVTQGAGGGVPTVSIVTTDDDASENGSNPGEFNFTLSSPQPNPLTIEFLIGGTAQNTADYQTLPSSITIPAGSREARLSLVPIPDGLTEGDETVTLQLKPSGSYNVGSPSVGFLRIHDVAVNQPPSISAVADQTLPERSAITIGFRISDPETDASSLTVRGASSDTAVVPGTGITFGGAGADRTVTIAPGAGRSGSSRITLFVSDGSLESSTSFSITVLPANLPPTAASQTIGTVKDRSVNIVLAGSDPEGAALNFVLKSSPQKGTLSGTPPNFRYQPALHVTGQDSFTFAASDGELESAPATVTINIAETNRAPVAIAQSVEMNEDTSATIVLTGSDPDGDPLEFELLTGPAKGVFTGRGNSYQYTPATNVFGSDSFTFRVSDGTLFSEPATVSINIANVNDAPLAFNSTVQVLEDGSTPVTLSATDADLDALNFQVVALPTKGRLSGTAPSLVYTPFANSVGNDSISFKVTDGHAESAVAMVSLVIVPVNDAPVAVAQELNTAEDQPIAVVIGGSDVDGDPLTFRIVVPPKNGVLSGTPPNLLYVPNTNANGADAFVFVVNDGRVDSAPATVTVQVEARNDPPVIGQIATQWTAKNRETGPIPLHLEDVDKPISDLTVTAESSRPEIVPAANVQITGQGTDRSMNITPLAGATGTTIITLKVSDGVANAQTSFLFTVTNSPPVAVADAVNVFGEAISIPTGQLLANDSDPDGDALKIVSVSSDAPGGAVQLTNEVITYTAPTGATEGRFAYVIEDTSGATATGTVTLSLRGAPRIQSIQVGGGDVVLRVDGIPSSPFYVQSSENARAWAEAGEGVTDEAGRGEFRESGGAGKPHRFYRVQWR